jgi:hypothetical protein
MRTMILMLCGAIGASGCSAAPPPHAAPADDIVAITLDFGPCYGGCAAYSARISADGHGLYTGNRYVRVKGAQAFRATPASFANVRALLAPYRPAADLRIAPDNPALCGQPVTDAPSRTISWSLRDGRKITLFYYLGCLSPKLKPLLAAITAARAQLPIDTLAEEVKGA